MTAALVIAAILTIIAWGFWRRWMGGWGGKPPFDRATKFAVLGLLLWPAWMVEPALAAVIWGVASLYWAKGHDWTSLSALLLRYGPFGLCWWVAQRLPAPPRVKLGQTYLIDGPIAVAELSAGALVGLAINLPFFAALYGETFHG